MDCSSYVKGMLAIIAPLAILLVTTMDVCAIDGDLTIFTLPNGMEVVIKEDHARSVTALQIWAKVAAPRRTQRRRN